MAADLKTADKRALLERLVREKAKGARREHPLSANQEGLWVSYQNAPASSAYNIAFAVRILSDVDAAALAKACQILVDRHAALRTRIIARNEGAVQEVRGSEDVNFKLVDASRWSVSELELRIDETRRRPFDLSAGPVYRFMLFRVGACDHVLLFVVHHIVHDAWSLWTLIGELGEVYPRIRRGTAHPLPPLTTTYGDFVAWQKKLLDGPEGEKLWTYWRDRLAGSLPKLNLPADRPRPPVQTDNGASLAFAIDASLDRALRAFAKAEDVTLYMIFAAALKVLLHRYSGLDDILVGSPTAGRNRPEFAPVVGYFVNPVVLRTDFSGDPTFRELLQQVKTRTLEAIAHQDFPFPTLVQRLTPERDPSYSPVFQVMFAFQKPQLGRMAGLVLPPEEGRRVQWAGLDVQPCEIAQQEGQFDLLLEVMDLDGTLSGKWKYSSDLFDRESVQRFAASYLIILEQAATRAGTKAGSLRILEEEAYQRQMFGWNATERVFASATIIQAVERTAREEPGRLAAVYEDETITYGELNARANRLARHLSARLTLKVDDVVGIQLGKSIDFLVAVLATWKAGGAYLPLDLTCPAERAAYMLGNSGCRLLVTQGGREDAPPPGVDVLDITATDLAAFAPDDLRLDVPAGALAYVIYTSGSTGRPKGVGVEHSQLLNYANAFLDRVKLPAGSSCATVTAISTDLGHTAIFPCLLDGGTVHLVSAQRASDPAALVEYFRAHPVDCLKIVPSHFAALVQTPEAAHLMPRRVLILGGESPTWTLVEKLRSLGPNCEIYNHYGPTETTVGTAMHRIDGRASGSSGRVPIGTPLANTRILVLDRNRNPVPIGVAGELHVAGAGVARGYLGQPEANAEKFSPCPFTGGRMYRTGDLGRWLPDGSIEFIGRIDTQHKIRGYRIELGEIEAALHRHPDVTEVTVQVVGDDEQARRLCVYFAARRTLALAELRDFLAPTLPTHMLPSAAVQLETIPLTSNGKIDVRRLPQPAVEAPSASADTEITGDVAAILAAVWREVLKIERIGPDDNFMSLGGDSVKAIQVAARLKGRGYRMAVSDLFRYPTVAGLAPHVTADSIVIDQAPVAGEIAAIPVQAWFFDEAFAEPHHWNQSSVFFRADGYDLAALQRAIYKLVEHHDVLRCVVDGPRRMLVTRSIDEIRIDLRCHDLRHEPRAAERIEAISAALQAEVDLAGGPLFKAAVHRTDRGDFLLFVIHHLLVDGVSWRILSDDLALAYDQALEANPVALPRKTHSFQAWAACLREYAAGAEVLAEYPFWKEMCAAASPQAARRRTRLAEVRKHRVEVPADLSRAIVADVHRAYGTEVNDILLCAVGLALGCLMRGRPVLVDIEGHGREDIRPGIDVTRTVGWFTTRHPLALDTGADDGLSRYIQRTKERIRRVPRKGIGYGVLRYLSDLPAGEREALCVEPPVSYNYLGQLGEDLMSGESRHGPFTFGPARSPAGHLSFSLSIAGVLAGDRFLFLVDCDDTWGEREVRLFAQEIPEWLATIAEHCLGRSETVATPSDFDATDLEAEELDSIVSEFQSN